MSRRIYEALVIGGGPAGLAAAASLKAQGIDAVVLESGHRVGGRWANHYDRLHLHTSRRFSGLPGHPIPRSYGRFIERDAVLAYLDQYAAVHGVEVVFGVHVDRIDRRGPLWTVTAGSQEYAASVLVIATGYANVPHVPDWPGLDGFTGDLIHVADYRNPAPYRGKDVLVVGPGNSGAEVSVDLAEGGAGRVRLAVRTPPNIVPKTILGVAAQAHAILLTKLPISWADRVLALTQRLFFGDLGRVGLGRPPRGAFTQIERDDVTPILDVGLIRALRLGVVERVGAVLAFDGDSVELGDGSAIQPDAVIVATGYERGLQGLVGHLGVLDESGRPTVRGGAADPRNPGLYFLGYRPVPSGNLREMGLEARRMAGGVARRGEVRPLEVPASVESGNATDVPVVLIHGAGSHRSNWAPVRTLLTQRGRRVITVDLPAMGSGGVDGLADQIEAVFDDIGLGRADIVGNSLGGTVALELARRGRAVAVVALAPAGYWSPIGHRYAGTSLKASQVLIRLLDWGLPLLTSNPVTRTLLLAQFVGRPWRMPAPAALSLLRQLGRRGISSPVATALAELDGVAPVPDGPVTIVWGTRDLFTRCPPQGRIEELTRKVKLVRLPGCGHLMTWDDPEGIALVIMTATRADSNLDYPMETHVVS